MKRESFCTGNSYDAASARVEHIAQICASLGDQHGLLPGALACSLATFGEAKELSLIRDRNGVAGP